MDKLPFIILSTQRSGSTLLRLYLDQSPEIRAHDEIFINRANGSDFFHAELQRTFWGRRYLSKLENRATFRGPIANQLVTRYLGRLFSHSPKFSPPVPTNDKGVDIFSDGPPISLCEAKAVGFKLMYNQLEVIPPLAQWLSRNPVRVIHLIRSNLLDIVVSGKLAHARDLFHATNMSAVDPISPINLDPKETLAQIRHLLEAQTRNHYRFINKSNYLIASFERLVDSPHQELGEICSFLGCAPLSRGLPPPLKKVVNRPIREVIRNYGEIENEMANAGLVHHPLTGFRFTSDPPR